MRVIRINKPYSELAGLTDEQRSKISELEKKTAAARSALEKQEEQDIRALLTDDQKTELDKLAAEKHAKMSEKRAEKKEPKKAAEGEAPAAPAAPEAK
jgi:Spy/CpxP family protein refolding chaperone